MCSSALPREVLKWIQSLDLSCPIRNPKWDLSSGYLVAEILSWYYPQDIELPLFVNASSLDVKLSNWQRLKKFMNQRRFGIPENYCDAVMHCKDGAGTLLLQTLYELLTSRQLKTMPAERVVEFTDDQYQSQLPDHQRSTAVQAIRNNLKSTELQLCDSLAVRRQLAQNIINKHAEDRAMARYNDPQRYNCQPVIGELAVRQAPCDCCCSDCSDQL